MRFAGYVVACIIFLMIIIGFVVCNLSNVNLSSTNRAAQILEEF